MSASAAPPRLSSNFTTTRDLAVSFNRPKPGSTCLVTLPPDVAAFLLPSDDPQSRRSELHSINFGSSMLTLVLKGPDGNPGRLIRARLNDTKPVLALEFADHDSALSVTGWTKHSLAAGFVRVPTPPPVFDEDEIPSSLDSEEEDQPRAPSIARSKTMNPAQLDEAVRALLRLHPGKLLIKDVADETGQPIQDVRQSLERVGVQESKSGVWSYAY